MPSGRCLALLLITALVAGTCTVSGQLSNADTKISISFNPCNGHACPAGETCKAVVNPRLLQLPVARCVKSSTTSDNGECTEVAVGSNILNCKTEEEWINIARIQCMFRGGTNSMQFTAMQLNHACYSRTSGATKFLSAAFSCCLTQAASPSTETVTTLSPNPSSTNGSPKVLTDTIVDQASTSSSNTGSSTAAAVQDDPVVTTTYHYFIMAVFAVAVLLVAGLIVVCTVMRRRTQSRKRSSKAPPTVYINASCEDHHNHLKHSHSSTTQLSSPDLVLVQHQY